MMPFSMIGVLSTSQMVMIAIVVWVVMFLFGMIVLVMKQYKRCPPNRALVVYGRTSSTGTPAQVVHGGAAFVVPLLQDYGYLYLEPIQVDVATLTK